jgi:hypothetical protein
MKRSWFLAYLAGLLTPGVATAQKIAPNDFADRGLTFKDKFGNHFLGKSTPVNNQCPACGQMAPPWIVGNGASDQTPECKPTVGGKCAPDERHIDCERCNATFRQRRTDPAKIRARFGIKGGSDE